MKIPVIVLSVLLSASLHAAEDTKMLFTPAAGGASAALVLTAGETAEVKFCSYNPEGSSAAGASFTVGANGTSYTIAAFVRNTSAVNSTDTYRANPVKIAGPATLTFNTHPALGSQFATVEVKRAGVVTDPVAIPQEPGTNWKIILEASSDLVNWIAVSPGEFPDSTPRRYFRMRMVGPLPEGK